MSFTSTTILKPLTLAFLLVSGSAVLAGTLLAQDHSRMHESTAPAQNGLSPYAGMEQRAIKALAPKDIQGLLHGLGMGFAMTAELNRYPGPRHVLDLAKDLSLSEKQREDTEALFQRMQSHAIDLGRQIVQEEEALDRLFAEGKIDQAQLERMTAGIASLRGQLRATHLGAHLEMTALLTPEQVSRYQQLRGYMHPAPGGHDPAHAHQGGPRHNR